MSVPRWRDAKERDVQRAELRAIYAEVDALLAPITCDASTECCRFGVTGREPYPTAVEIAEVIDAAAQRGIAVRPGGASRRSSKRLPLAGGGNDEERRCPMLDSSGRCRIYAARPFGCRTFFCERATGKPPRAAVQELSRLIAALSARAFPADPKARPLSRVLAEALGK